jgi:ABC-type uncharacterized transport system substrate-binding protein
LQRSLATHFEGLADRWTNLTRAQLQRQLHDVKTLVDDWMKQNKPVSVSKTIIGIVANERTRHIDRAKNGFSEAINRRVKGHRIIDEIGSANNDTVGDAINAQAFKNLFELSQSTYGRAPDVLVTVGTQVSVYAAQHYSQCARFFFSVSDPIKSNLVTEHERNKRANNIAGFANGINRTSMIQEMVRYFPGKTFAFLYGEHQLQDVQMVEFLKSPEISALIPIVAFVAGDISRPKIDQTLLNGAHIMFGWNLLSTNIDRFVNANPDVPFIGQHYEHKNSDVMASFGLDFWDLGVAAANCLITEHLDNKRPLGDIQIDFSHRVKWYFNEQQMKRFGIKARS